MNLTETEVEQKAAKYAKTLLTNAVKNEPEITETLREIALEVSAEIVGLEHKFKTQESLSRKIAETSVKNIRRLSELGHSLEDAIDATVKIKTENINDALRYTFAFSDEKYVFGFKQSLQKIKQKGFSIPTNKIWNAWKNIDTVFDKGYRGINSTIISSQGQFFELQFHTRSSYQLKTETHFLYEELREIKTSHERKDELIKELIEMAQIVKVPKGVKKL